MDKYLKISLGFLDHLNTTHNMYNYQQKGQNNFEVQFDCITYFFLSNWGIYIRRKMRGGN